MKRLLLLFSVILITGFSFGQYTSIPDPNFEQTLIDNGYDNIIDGQVLTSNISSQTFLSTFGYGINDFTGIEDFAALEFLMISDENISNLNLDSNLALLSLEIGNTPISNLNLSNNINLTDLVIDMSPCLLDSIDLSANINLQYVVLEPAQSANGIGQLNNLIVPASITSLFITYNQLSNIDLSMCTSLQDLRITGNYFTEIDLNMNTALSWLECENNLLNSLDLSNNLNLTYLSCPSNNLSCLDLRNGNNTNMIGPPNLNNNPLLSCISVDDSVYSQLNWGNSVFIDPQHYFSNNCTNGCNGNIVEICAVGTDDNGNNRVVWEKNLTNQIDSFYVYRESSVLNQFELIGSIPYTDSSIYIDNSANPQVESNRYKLSSIDLNGDESVLSTNPHKTIHLTINQGVGQDWNLIWNHYEGFSYSNYEIYRGYSPDTMTLLTSIASNSNSYTDQTANPGNIYYQIVAINPDGCNPSKSTEYASSKSNISTNNTTSLNENKASLFTVFPNPTTNSFTITSEKVINSNFRIMDGQGREVLTGTMNGQEHTMDISILSKGVYLVVFEQQDLPVLSVVKE